MNTQDSITATRSKAARQVIDEAIAALFQAGDVVELRIPKAGRFKTISGYFDDFNKLARAIEQHSGDFEGIYYILNHDEEREFYRSPGAGRDARPTASLPKAQRMDARICLWQGSVRAFSWQPRGAG